MKDFVKFIAAICVALVLMLVFRALFFTIYTVPNESLVPMFKSGDRVIVNKWSYGLRTGDDKYFRYSRWMHQDVCKGDMVAFNYPLDTLSDVSSAPVYLSRCTGLPGDTLNIDNKVSVIVPGHNVVVDVNETNAVLLCNTMRLHEHRDCYVKNGQLYLDGRITNRIQFENNYYWMSSLSPFETDDSRYFGFVPENNIIGRAVMIIYSKDDKKPFYNRLRKSRFLKFI